MTVIVAGDEMTIDLSELPAEVKAPMNSGRSGGGATVARLAFRYLLLPEGDANEGTFRPLKLILPEGTIVSATADGADGRLQFGVAACLIDLVIRALGPALPERAAAAHYGTFSTLAYAGRHPDTGAFWQCYDSGFGGWGALYDMDGPGPFRTDVPRRHAAHSDRAARGDLSVHDRELQPARRFRRSRRVSRWTWARAPLPDAGAVPHLHSHRAHRLARPGE